MIDPALNNSTATPPIDNAENGGDILLAVKNLRIDGYGESGAKGKATPIVRGVSLTLRRGEVLGLIGESGAGKSTIGLAAMGYTRDGCRITGGEIFFDGADLAKNTDAQNNAIRGKRIAYVAQSAAASFNPAHRLIDQCCESAVKHGVKTREQAAGDSVALYRRLQLPEPDSIGFRYPHQVSGGQLQRAMTAMAMSCNPDLIIFDEPTTALDVTTQIEVLAAIRDAVKTQNSAAIYVTHDLAVVAQMAHRIIVLKDGVVVEENQTRAMLSAPREEYTKTLWAVRAFQKQNKPPPQSDALAQIKNVSAKYGDEPVLNNVSMQIHRGRTLAVVGESGSGKSTTARCCTGLLPPVSGEILWRGEPLPPSFKTRTREQLQKMQMIYQMADVAVNPAHTVRDIIGRPLEFYLGLRGKERDARVCELLEQIELDPQQFINRKPAELSGGQKQRVCIARALAAQPEFVICDEVTSALDQLVAEGILRLLQNLQDKLGLAYMFITHDISTVRAIADDVAVMKNGEVIESAPRDEFFTPPHDPYSELLLSSAPEMDPDWLDNLLQKRAA